MWLTRCWVLGKSRSWARGQVNRAVMGWLEHLRGSGQLLITNQYKLEYFRLLTTGMTVLECPAEY